MFCEKCGTENREDSKMCSKCGAAIISIEISEQIIKNIKFYGIDWKSDGMGLATVPVVDILIDQEKIYVLNLPKTYAAAWGMGIGFLFLSIIGLAIGGAIGASRDKKKRVEYRKKWLNNEQQLISQKYRDSVTHVMPLRELRGKTVIKKRKVEILFNSKKIVMKANKDRVQELQEVIRTYVL